MCKFVEREISLQSGVSTLDFSSGGTTTNLVSINCAMASTQTRANKIFI